MGKEKKKKKVFVFNFRKKCICIRFYPGSNYLLLQKIIFSGRGSVNSFYKNWLILRLNSYSVR